MKLVSVILTIVFAFGVGVTGTLLWTETRPRPVTPTPIPTTASNAVPDISDIPQLPGARSPASNTEGPPVSAQNEEHEPPADLTRSMSPPEAALTLGNWHYDHEQWALAIEKYRTAIQGGVDNPNIRTDLGNALRFSDQPQEALQHYRRAQKQDPTHEQSLFNQGALYAVSLNNPRKGIKIWETYLKRFPEGSSASQARELIAKFGSTE